MIELTDVHKRYGRYEEALSGVDLHVDPGEFVFIVGPSGAGKTTLIRLLYREELPTSGTVRVAGKDLSRMRPREVPYFRRQVGVVFQDFKLLPERTVWDNVAFALVVTEVPPKEIRRKVPAVLELVGLRDRARMKAQELSGGEQQRVAIARAMVHGPPLLIADEPTGNLDPATAWEVMQLLVDVNHRGTTVVVASHAKALVDALRRRVVELAAGRVVRDEVRGLYVHEA